MEHRRGQRTIVSLLITLDTRYQESLDGEIVDVSASGAFIRLQDFVPEPNTIVRLNFNAAISEHAPQQCRALVVRRDGDGVGVMFDQRQDVTFLSNLAADIDALAVGKAAQQYWAARPTGRQAPVN